MLKNKIYNNLIFLFFLAFIMPSIVFGAESPKILDDDYIYFDLNYGNVTISGTSYTGYVLVDGVSTKKTGTIDRKIYIYQSNGESTIWENGLPKYERVQAPTTSGKTTWGDYITNNKSVENVIDNWPIQANAVNRSSTGNRIEISGGSCDITIDNIWSSYQLANTTRGSGGISYYPNGVANAIGIIRMKGDNRLGNIFYATATYANQQLVLDGEENSTLTVANINKTSNANHFNSAIGGSDNYAKSSEGIVINNGIIYAGTTYGDNCTAIGGGGNEKGGVIINGGTITAVVSSTGTAIGGGIGYSSVGGDANVEINGGTVYAYNFGFEGIPACAIGGGSSNASNGNSNTTITITGGVIYAESVGGTAIGGGSSKTRNGGPATIDIKGTANITAKSTSGTYSGKEILAGAAIGGGTGGSSSGVSGGNATVTISGSAKLYTGSIGGGKTNNSTGKIGNATIKISGTATVQGQFIMAAGSSNPCSFEMSGGTINNKNKTNDFVFLQQNGGAVYIENGTATISGGTIENCSAVNGGAIYIQKGTAMISGGTITSCSATNGGAIYITGGDGIVTSGQITSNNASNEGGAIYVNDGNAIIGLESCGGIDDSHIHPMLSNNIATNNGGGISLVGGELEMYCGNLVDNKCRNNQASNSVNQTGGKFDTWGGNLGIGILVVEPGVFNDYREEIYRVTFHAIYGDVNETMTSYVKANEILTLPSELEIENEKFTREDLPLLGWSTNSNSTQGYMVVGEKIPIPSDVDLYAVWGVKSYIIYIPEFIEISESETEIITFSASISMFSDTDCINVILSEKNELVHENSDESLTYELIDEETEEIIEVDDCIVTFSNENLDEKNMLISIKENQKLYYSGRYTGLMTFTVEEGSL